MGSGTSRGKKVAPACASEVDVTKSASSVTSSKQDGRPFKPFNIDAFVRNARNRAQPPDRHSEGHDSDFSGEDDRGEGDAVVADVKKRERSPPPRKMKSRTYGLCHFSQQDAEDDFGSAPQLRASGRAEEPRGPRGGSGDVNRSKDAFTHLKIRTSDCSSLNNSSTQGFLLKRDLLQAAPTSEKQSCCSSSLTMPVILFDGSEEELMDTIEKEFS